jgi:cytochrome c oxidase subunit IV
MGQNQHGHGNKAPEHHFGGGHHIVPFPVLAKVAAALLLLTALTVATARMHLGVLAAPVAFAIALVKAFLVMGFFMGLKYDVKSNRMIFASGFFFLLLLFFICALDIWTRVSQTNTL